MHVSVDDTFKGQRQDGWCQALGGSLSGWQTAVAAALCV